MSDITFVSGFKPSPFDFRDYNSKAAIATDTDVERVFSWRKNERRVIDQGKFGICVGCAASGIKDIQENDKGDLPVGGFSPLFLYFLAKTMDGDPNSEGTYPRIDFEEADPVCGFVIL